MIRFTIFVWFWTPFQRYNLIDIVEPMRHLLVTLVIAVKFVLPYSPIPSILSSSLRPLILQSAVYSRVNAEPINHFWTSVFNAITWGQTRHFTTFSHPISTTKYKTIKSRKMKLSQIMITKTKQKNHHF